MHLRKLDFFIVRMLTMGFSTAGRFTGRILVPVYQNKKCIRLNGRHKLCNNVSNIINSLIDLNHVLCHLNNINEISMNLVSFKKYLIILPAAQPICSLCYLEFLTVKPRSKRSNVECQIRNECLHAPLS